MTGYLEEIIQDEAFVRQLVLTGLLLLGLLVARAAARRMTRRAAWASDKDKLRISAQLRMGIGLLFLLSLVLVWASELQTLAVSVVAVAGVSWAGSFAAAPGASRSAIASRSARCAVM